MISVKEGISIIEQSSQLMGKEYILVSESLGYVLAEDVKSPINMPPFDQSAMDGYAVCGLDLTHFDLIGEIKAGDSPENMSLEQEQAIRIFTGAMIPKNTEAVIKQEDIKVSDSKIEVLESFKKDDNIRGKGEQILKDGIALERGTLLNAGTIGFLAMLGIQEVNVYIKPKISIVATGSELTPLGKKLTPGKIYESNTLMLQMALKEFGFESDICTVKDDYDETLKTIKKKSESCDVLLVSGGISVGDYDFVKDILEEIGIKKQFYKLKQKPGKPLYFGKNNEKLVFALPGNPAAALTSFYVYVLLALKIMTGRSERFLQKQKAYLEHDFTKAAGKTFYLKGIYENGTVSVLSGQSSASVQAFSKANCLIVLDEEEVNFYRKDQVEIILLKQ